MEVEILLQKLKYFDSIQVGLAPRITFTVMFAHFQIILQHFQFFDVNHSLWIENRYSLQKKTSHVYEFRIENYLIENPMWRRGLII